MKNDSYKPASEIFREGIMYLGPNRITMAAQATVQISKGHYLNSN
jgi:hypothetical protein